MSPEQVPAELVEKAARALRDEQCTGHDHGTDACPDRHCRDDRTLPFYRARVRPALAATHQADELAKAGLLRPQDGAQEPQDGANGGDVGSGKGEGVSTPQTGAQAPGEGKA